MSKGIFKIENEFFSVKVKSLGAELSSMFSKKSNREVVWQGDDSFPRQANNLFPNCGPIKDEYFIVNEIKYAMKQHGFARHREFELAMHTDTAVSFVLKSDDATKAVYPYEFEFYNNFELIGEKLLQTYKIVNKSTTEVMYYGVGAHTGFNIPMADGDNSDDYYVDFGDNKPFVVETNSSNLLSGKKIKVNLEDGKFNLSDTVFDEDSFIFGGFEKKELTLRSKNSSHFVTVKFDDFENCVLWCMKGKLKYLCIEPWNSLPDACDTDHDFAKKVGILSLEGGQTATHTQEFTAE